MSTSWRSTESQARDPEATEVIQFEWQKLLAFGISNQDAQMMIRALAVRDVMPAYWRRLIEAGIPLNDAKTIAKAIACHDTGRKPLSLHQQKLILQYLPLICRADLWRPNLLMT
ncbi:MAG: hypothetical protein ACFE0J_17175 [Elainellaceae cyanobacterium]